MSGKLKEQKDVNLASKKAADKKRHSTRNDFSMKAANVTTEMSAISKSKLVPIRAYELWLLDGQCHGKDKLHWFQAEKELSGN